MIEIVEKAREKLKLDQGIANSKAETSAALIEAATALEKTHKEVIPSTTLHEKYKLRKKKKSTKKKVVEATEVPQTVEPAAKEKINKRKLINDTYTKIMKAEMKRKAEEKNNQNKKLATDDEDVPPEVVENFFAMRRQESTDNLHSAIEKPSSPAELKVDKAVKNSLEYWTSIMSAEGNTSKSQRKSSIEGAASSNQGHRSTTTSNHTHSIPDSKSPKLSKRALEATETSSDVKSPLTNGNENSECHLQLNSSPYEIEQARKENEQANCIQDGNDYADDFYDEDFENDTELPKLELAQAFKDSDSHGDDYEHELNLECERLRAELEKKIMAKFEA